MLTKRFLRFSHLAKVLLQAIHPAPAEPRAAAFPLETTIPPTMNGLKLCFLKVQTGNKLLRKVFTRSSYFKLWRLGLGAVSVITNTVRHRCSLIKNKAACSVGDQIVNGMTKQVFCAGKVKKQNLSHPTSQQ